MTQIQRELQEIWKTVYQKHDNDTIEMWNPEIKSDYEKQMLMINNEGKQSIKEHLDMTMQDTKSFETYERLHNNRDRVKRSI